MQDADSGYEMIRKVAEREVDRLHLLEYGKVESVNVHGSESDKIGYTCSVLLVGRTTDDGEMLKIENVPIITGFMGMIDLPNVDDLVLVGYINGDFELPVILGRLYSKEKLPPILEEGQYLMEMAPERYDETSKKPRKIDIKFIDGSQTTIHFDNSLILIKSGNNELRIMGDNEDGMSIQLGHSKGFLQVHEEGGVVIRADEDIMINTKKNLIINAKENVEIQGKKIELNK